MRGRKPKPMANAGASTSLAALPRCPPHLSDVARREWRRISGPLHQAGLLTVADRAALAAYCQAFGRWVEAEERLKETPVLLRTPSGYAQQSPWLSIANKQLELMGRYMAELGLTPSARTRLDLGSDVLDAKNQITRIELVSVYTDENGQRVEQPLTYDRGRAVDVESNGKTVTYELDERL